MTYTLSYLNGLDPVLIQRIRRNFYNEMHYTNLHFTYFPYLLSLFWVRNWFHIATYPVLFVRVILVLDGVMLFRTSLMRHHFKLDRDDMICSSIPRLPASNYDLFTCKYICSCVRLSLAAASAVYAVIFFVPDPSYIHACLSTSHCWVIWWICEYFSPSNMGLLDPSTSDGRVIFFLPWEKSTMAGRFRSVAIVDMS